MKKLTAYLSGPISANPEYEEDFAKAEAMLVALGYEALNPVELVREKIPAGLSALETWKKAMEIDLEALKKADMVVLLDRKDLPSAGMDIEIDTARKKGIPIITIDRIRRSLELKRQNSHRRVR